VNVIRIGSFSKTLSASVRCGYIAARAEWIETLVDIQVATSFGGASAVAARLVFDSLMDTGYRRHVEGLRRRLSAARRDVSSKLADLGVTTWVKPGGGFYLWARLPDGRDASVVARAALEQGVILAPGDVFSVNLQASDFVRFNVGQMQSPRVYEMLKTALASS
jgi:DNA-binding transcriptional MocR family regulator